MDASMHWLGASTGLWLPQNTLPSREFSVFNVSFTPHVSPVTAQGNVIHGQQRKKGGRTRWVV